MEKIVDDEEANPNQSKIICELRQKKKNYYDQSTKKEIKEKLSKLGIVKPHQASYVIKDLLGDSSAAENENQRDILERHNIAIAADEDIVVDLRSNNGKKLLLMHFGKLLLSIKIAKEKGIEIFQCINGFCHNFGQQVDLHQNSCNTQGSFD